MDRRGLGGLQALVFVVGVYEGVVPLISRLFGWSPALAFPLHLPDPYWWVVSVSVIVVAVVLLEVLDRKKDA